MQQLLLAVLEENGSVVQRFREVVFANLAPFLQLGVLFGLDFFDAGFDPLGENFDDLAGWTLRRLGNFIGCVELLGHVGLVAIEVFNDLKLTLLQIHQFERLWL